MNAGPGFLSRPIRTVLRWQGIATVVLTLAGGMFAGVHGAVSAALGGAVSLCAFGLSAVLVSRSRAQSAGDVITWALLAEGLKIGLIAVLLWVILAAYGDVIVPVLIGSFLVTVLLFTAAFFVRDHN